VAIPVIVCRTHGSPALNWPHHKRALDVQYVSRGGYRASEKDGEQLLGRRTSGVSIPLQVVLIPVNDGVNTRLLM